MESSQLWKQLSQELFHNVGDDFLRNFREPGKANNRLAAWDPFDGTMRFFKFLLFNQCKAKPDAFFEHYRRLGDTQIGNPVTIRVVRQGMPVDVNLDHFFSIEEFSFLAENIDLAEIGHVIEIGAGFGRTAHALLKLCSTVETYTIIDLPNVLKLSSLYLEAVLDEQEFAKLKFVDAMGIADSKALNCGAADLVINIDSFQEMKPEVIDFYMNNIASHARFFYSKNAIGKYRPETIGLPSSLEAETNEIFQLGRSREIIDIFCNSELEVARTRHMDAYRPSAFFRVIGEAPLDVFPYYHNTLYARNYGQAA
ncbi:MAG: putative sugar O-methyltransferase [Rhodocyclaceae bacterium]|nr:putative sugar O-methyltransferase [Rhodocyclaceae bacterium]